MDSFKNWLDDLELIESVINGEIPPQDTRFQQFLDYMRKIEKWVGIKKFLISIPKTLLAKVMFVIAVIKFFKNPLDKAALNEVINRLTEVGKLSIYSGASIPAAMVVGGIMLPGYGEFVAGILAKTVTYAYFYMGQWANNNIENPKYSEVAKKIQNLMPQTMN